MVASDLKLWQLIVFLLISSLQKFYLSELQIITTKIMLRSIVIFLAEDKEQQIRYIYQHPELDFIQTYESAAYSVIVSLAEYLTWKFPHLIYINQKSETNYNVPRIQTFPNYFISLHKAYYQWINMLCQAIQLGNAVRIGDQCVFRVEINQQFSISLQKNGFYKFREKELSQQNLLHQDISKICTIQDKPIIIYAECHDIDMRHFFYGQYFDNQTWICFNILKGEFPTKSDYAKAKAIIVPGSSKSVYDKTPEIQNFSKDVQQALKQNSQLKYLGICFGAQLLAHLMGGKVEKMQNLVSNVRSIFVLPKKQMISKVLFLNQFFAQQEYKVFQYHQDEITTLPCGFQIIASSPETEKQIIISQDGRMLGIQCHPEYSIGRYVCNKIQQQFCGFSSPQEIHSILETNAIDQYDQTHVLRRMISQFLGTQ